MSASSINGGARLFLAFVLGFLAAMGPLCTDFYLPALPQMAADLSTTASEMQLSITASLLGLSLGQLFFGPYSDAKGRKKPLLASLVVFIITSFLCGRATGIAELITLRFIQGLAGSGGMVLSRAIACDLFRGTDLTKFFALLMLINGVAPIFGPVVGGQIMGMAAWPAIFYFLAICGVLQFLLVLFGCGETLPEEKRVQGGVASSVRGMCRLFKNKLFLYYLLLQGFLMAAFFGYISASPFVLQKLYGLSAQGYGLCFALNGTGIMVFSFVTGRLCPRFGDRRLLRIGVALCMVAAVLVAVVSILHLPVYWMVPSLFLFVSSTGIICTTSFSLAIAAQSEGAGSASGLLGVATFVFGAAASPLVGLGGDSTAVPLGMLMLLSNIFVVIFYKLASRREKRRALD